MYKVYILDAKGRVCAPAQIVECDDDKEAIQKARKFVAAGTVELWQDNRLIARVEAA